MSKPRFYHGGPAGRRLLSLLQPPSVTGVTPSSECSDELIRSKMAKVYRRDRVYVTPNVNAAVIFASFHIVGGCVYEVEPIGDLEHDPDCFTEGLSFTCARARVLRVYPVPPHVAWDIRKKLGISQASDAIDVALASKVFP